MKTGRDNQNNYDLTEVLVGEEKFSGLRLLYSALSKEHMYEVQLAFHAQVERTACSLNILFFWINSGWVSNCISRVQTGLDVFFFTKEMIRAKRKKSQSE